MTIPLHNFECLYIRTTRIFDAVAIQAAEAACAVFGPITFEQFRQSGFECGRPAIEYLRLRFIETGTEVTGQGQQGVNGGRVAVMAFHAARVFNPQVGAICCLDGLQTAIRDCALFGFTSEEIEGAIHESTELLAEMKKFAVLPPVDLRDSRVMMKADAGNKCFGEY